MNPRTKEAQKLVGNWYVVNDNSLERELMLDKLVRVYTQDGYTLGNRESLSIEDRYLEFHLSKGSVVYSSQQTRANLYDHPAKDYHFRRAIKMLFRCTEFEVYDI
jgi:hypothetical protein